MTTAEQTEGYIECWEVIAEDFAKDTGVNATGSVAMLPPCESDAGYDRLKNTYQHYRTIFFQRPSKVFNGLWVESSLTFDVREKPTAALCLVRCQSCLIDMDECDQQGRETGKPVGWCPENTEGEERQDADGNLQQIQ